MRRRDGVPREFSADRPSKFSIWLKFFRTNPKANVKSNIKQMDSGFSNFGMLLAELMVEGGLESMLCCAALVS